ESLVLPAPARPLPLLPTVDSRRFHRCINGTAKGRGLSPPAPVASPCSWRRNWCLLDFDGRACGLEVLLHLLGVFLRSAFLHGAAGLGEVLGFLQAQPGDGADGLD